MTQYRVDSAAVLAQASAAQASVTAIQAEVARLHSRLTGLQESWQGSAASAFQGVLADWRATQQRVEESLAGISQALQHAGRQYDEAERANLGLFAR